MAPTSHSHIADGPARPGHRFSFRHGRLRPPRGVPQAACAVAGFGALTYRSARRPPRPSPGRQRQDSLSHGRRGDAPSPVRRERRRSERGCGRLFKTLIPFPSRIYLEADAQDRTAARLRVSEEPPGWFPCGCGWSLDSITRGSCSVAAEGSDRAGHVPGPGLAPSRSSITPWLVAERHSDSDSVPRWLRALGKPLCLSERRFPDPWAGRTAEAPTSQADVGVR